MILDMRERLDIGYVDCVCSTEWCSLYTGTVRHVVDFQTIGEGKGEELWINNICNLVA